MAPGKPSIAAGDQTISREPAGRPKRGAAKQNGPLVVASPTPADALHRNPKSGVATPPRPPAATSGAATGGCDRSSAMQYPVYAAPEPADTYLKGHHELRVPSAQSRATSSVPTRTGVCVESVPIPAVETSGDDRGVRAAATPRDEPRPVAPTPGSAADASAIAIPNASVGSSVDACDDRIATAPCDGPDPAPCILHTTAVASVDVGDISSGDQVAAIVCDESVLNSSAAVVGPTIAPPVLNEATKDSGPFVETPRVLGLSFRDVHAGIGDSWVLHCRVLARTPVRPFDTLTSTGKLFNAYLIDGMGETMRATVFNQGVELFDAILFTGAVCSLSRGKFKKANTVFSPDAWEVSFDDKSVITPFDDASLPRVAYAGEISGLEAVPSVPVKTKLTVLGIIHKTTPVQRLKTKDGKPCFKSRVLIVDSTMTQVVCTLWGYHTKENTAAFEGRPLLIRGAEVSEYNGSFSLNVGVGCTVLFDPSGPEADDLQAWYANLDSPAVFSSI